jgi:PAS domain S-box-containing protein
VSDEDWRGSPRKRDYLNSKVQFLAGGGEMGERMRAYDWQASVLGDPGEWPQGLKTTLRVILTTRHPAFIFWGPSLICFYNDAYRQSLGPEKHPGALGAQGREVWPEIWSIIGPQIDQVMEGGEATWHENQLVPIVRFGAIRDVYWTYSYGPIDEPTAPKAIGGVLVLCTETTQQVLTEKRLAADRQRLAQLFEQSPTFTAVLRGPQHVFELANPGYLRLIGHRPVLGRSLAEALPDAVAQGYLTLLDRVFQSGEPFTGTGAKYTVQSSASEPAVDRYVDFVYQPIKDSDGTVSGIFVQGADVTPWVLAESALRAKEAQLEQANAALERIIDERTSQLVSRETLLHTMYENSTECHAVLRELADGQFCYEEVNPATLRLYGLSRDAVVGHTTDEIFGARACEINGHLRACLAADAPYHYERAQGAGTVEAVAVAVPAADGRRVVVTARDVTERRRLEQELRQSQKMEAVGQLTGGLAHDFNNLLAGIGGSLEVLRLLLKQGRVEEFDRYLISASGAVKRAAALTHRLLAFARRQTLDARPTDLNRLVADIEDLVRRTVGPAIALEVVGAAGLWSTLVDPNQLESALLNLCINARDAMPDGGRLTIETANRWLDESAAREQEVPPGQYLALRVSDTGTGMTAEVVARAFDPFFTTKPLGQGTGLGLSMVYGFARQSGGQVRIYSEVGKGTTVCLYLPRHRADAHLPAPGPEVAHTDPAPQGMTVLLVDDEPTVRMVARQVLREHGYLTIEAEDGVQAMRILESAQRIDLLVTDVGLPGGINGRQLADAGRSLRRGLKVLFITGYAENAVIGHGHLEPGFHVMTKPFELAELVRRAGAIIANEPRPGASQQN